MSISNRDREILRSLAAQVAELAADPAQEARRERWRRHNELEGERPVILAYVHDSWPEFFSLQIEDPLLRGWEWTLRHTLAVAELGTDEALPRYFTVPYVAVNTDFGMPPRLRTVESARQSAYKWEPSLRRPEDLTRLVPGITVDFAASESNFVLAQELFGDLYEVRLTDGLGLGMDEKAAFLRGMDQMMLDMYDNPGFLHRLMAFLRDEKIKMLRYGETHQVFHHDDGRPAKLREIRGGEGAQTFVGISPPMWEEFLFQYQKPVLELFGTSAYGCCEPLHDKLDVLMTVSNLRWVSVSPWADLQVCAEKLQDRYLFSWKPHPAILAWEHFDPEEVRRVLREGLAIARGCKVEVIMKDVTTTRSQPQRLKTWVQIARKEVDRAWG